jgi:hypothetical protein
VQRQERGNETAIPGDEVKINKFIIALVLVNYNVRRSLWVRTALILLNQMPNGC